MATYVEGFRAQWHIQRSERFIRDHFESRTLCDLQIVPRNVWHGDFEGSVCGNCRRATRPPVEAPRPLLSPASAR